MTPPPASPMVAAEHASAVRPLLDRVFPPEQSVDLDRLVAAPGTTAWRVIEAGGAVS